MDSAAWRGFPFDWYPPAPVLVFPFPPMLAALKHSLPIGDQWLYEPKLDGFRGLLRHGTNGHVQVLSRNLRDLAPSFPELVQAAPSLPAGTLLDGEIVIADESGHADFGALQQRLTVARRAAGQVALRRPAVLLVFDVLELGGVPLTELPLRNRRKRLEDFLPGLHPSLQLMTQTRDLALAQQWLALLPAWEGVVAKKSDGHYAPGRRDWVKVKRHRTVDCVVIGLAGDAVNPALVLGLRHSDGVLHHFAVTRAMEADAGGPIADLLATARPEQAAIRSRWQHDAVPPWRRVEPTMVCEVRVTNLDLGRWARFPVAFVRWRTDRSVDDCGLEQLGS